MSNAFTLKNSYDINDLVVIMSLLRSENGCPWDREQTHKSIRNNFIEEVYEAIEAIDTEDTALLQEELGDVLLQVVFHSRMAEEENNFSFDDVCNDICAKLIRRHPHIFGDTVVDGTEQVLRNWDAIKRGEKQHTGTADTLYAVSRSLPGLIRTAKVQGRAAKAGFDYTNVREAIADLRSEIDELEAELDSGTQSAITDEMGDVLFSAVNVSRLLKREAEEVLSYSTDKFISRFKRVEEYVTEQNRLITDYTMEELNEIWCRVKNKKDD